MLYLWLKQVIYLFQIKIGLTADYNGKCVRSYSPVIEPSTTNNIILNFATKSNKRDSLLFFIGSKKEVIFTLVYFFMHYSSYNRIYFLIMIHFILFFFNFLQTFICC